MKRTLIVIVSAAAFVGAFETPAHSATEPHAFVAIAGNASVPCTAQEWAAINLANHLRITAADIYTTVNSQHADTAVNAIYDLVRSLDLTLPQSCQ